MYRDIVEFIKSLFGSDEFIPLHEPRFIGNEKTYLNQCIDSTFVSSIGMYVEKFEQEIAKYTAAKYAVATVNGTSALHIALILADVRPEDEVITQPLTFVATCNAISYCQAHPVFVDVDLDTLGLSPSALKKFLKQNCVVKNGQCINKKSGRIVRACIPMHTFGHPCKIDEIGTICDEYHITLIEDAAESLGSRYKNKHTGTYGTMGIFSFNGNKIITAGGGGCIVTDDESLAHEAKHLSTTAKVPHKWEYTHDRIGYNYRMPNLNAALLMGQLENLDYFLENKRELADQYKNFFAKKDMRFVKEPSESRSNYWLNAIILQNREERERFLQVMNSEGVMTRPIWTLMNKLPMYKNAQCDDLSNALWLEERVVNLPSSVRIS